MNIIYCLRPPPDMLELFTSDGEGLINDDSFTERSMFLPWMGFRCNLWVVGFVLHYIISSRILLSHIIIYNITGLIYVNFKICFLIKLSIDHFLVIEDWDLYVQERPELCSSSSL